MAATRLMRASVLVLCFCWSLLLSCAQAASVREGARLFVMRCLGCHSVSGLTARDLHDVMGLSAHELAPMFSASELTRLDPLIARIGESNARLWFGASAPPDLTNEVGVRGAAWVRDYLLGFYADNETVTGWNNDQLPGTQMPNPFFDEQGWRGAVIKQTHRRWDLHHHPIVEQEVDTIDQYGVHHRTHATLPFVAGMPMTTLTLAPFPVSVTQRQQNAEHIAQLVAFLCYVSDPSVQLRYRLAMIMLPLLCLLCVVLFLLKKLYWRQVNHSDKTSH